MNQLRLDEILLLDDLVTEEQIKKALEYQREHGGRIGSHLIRLGFIDEPTLLMALSKQFGCESVILTQVKIPPEVLKLIPSNVAIARGVFPFAFDEESNTLKVACENPNDQALIQELDYITQGRRVKLYIAAELMLRAAIARHYMVTVARPYDSGKVPVTQSASASAPGPNGRSAPRGVVMLVSNEPKEDLPLRQALERQNFRVITCDSADDAIEMLTDQSFHTVFIRDTVQGDYIDLIDRLRKVDPKTNVRYFESVAQLLLSDGSDVAVSDVAVRNLQLFTTLLAGNKESENHAGTVGHYVERLCQHLGLPDKERLVITSAAYLHDISRFYYGEEDSGGDCREHIPKTAKLLASLNYSPLLSGILKSTYINLRDKYTKRLPIETLGGNIITIVDIFVENVGVETKISLDKFEAIREKITDLTGKLFLPEVVGAFLEMIEKEILLEPRDKGHNQVLMYGDSEAQIGRVTQRLQAEGFRVVALQSRERFMELFSRSKPDFMIILSDGQAGTMLTIVDDMINGGVDMMKTPTFLLAHHNVAADLTSLFEQGIEDIIPIENDFDLLTVKLKKLRSRIEDKSSGKGAESNGGTAGKLQDLNLIDLLQALGPSRKTARMQIESAEGKLELCLELGQVRFAKFGEVEGPEAVYQALVWQEGEWLIEPAEADEFPEPNCFESNESILMEGCRRLDEQNHSKQIDQTQS